MNWNNINDLAILEQIKEESAQNPILIFKHSTTCSISKTAFSRIERNYDQDKVGGLKPYYLDLLNHRNISAAIATEFEVQHESPQILIIKNGKAIFNASHFDINFNDIVEKSAV